MAEVGFDFTFLKQQLDEGVLVEDLETLAELAILVPDLVIALEQVAGRDDEFVELLKTTKAVIARHSAY
ncbi:MAG: hypothetical protein NXH94_17800 [Rhodobacteraceae bacterium]|jgi:hypothetical protein|uniref:hypothetical protein n=1 Tax=Marivita sp. TaxID=2003365 RepID=UPI003B5161DA|nr:hypothetical protein [Paracoccaceae bacterium]